MLSKRRHKQLQQQQPQQQQRQQQQNSTHRTKPPHRSESDRRERQNQTLRDREERRGRRQLAGRQTEPDKTDRPPDAGRPDTSFLFRLFDPHQTESVTCVSWIKSRIVETISPFYKVQNPPKSLSLLFITKKPTYERTIHQLLFFSPRTCLPIKKLGRHTKNKIPGGRLYVAMWTHTTMGRG